MDAPAYNLMLSAYSRYGQLSESEWIMRQMVTERVEPTATSYARILDCCAEAGNGKAGDRWASSMKQAGYALNGDACAALARAYALEGRVQEADGKLDEMVAYRPAPKNKVVKAALQVATEAFRKAEDTQKLSKWKSWMAKNGMSVQSNKLVPSGKRPQGQVLRTGRSRQESFAVRIQMAGRSGDVDAVAKLMDEMQEQGETPGLFERNAMLESLSFGPASSGMLQAATKCFEQMQDPIRPDHNSYCHMIRCAVRAEDHEGAIRWFERLVESGASVEYAPYKLVVPAVAGRAKDANALLQRIVDTASGTSQKSRRMDLIIRALAEAGMDRVARKWMSKAAAENLSPTRSTLEMAAVAAFEGNRGDENVLWWLDQLHGPKDFDVVQRLNGFVRRCLSRNMDADRRTKVLDSLDVWLTELSATQLSAVELPYETMVLANAIVGRLEAATSWFERMVGAGFEAGVDSYNAMISTCGKRGYHETALRWFERMANVGVQPNLGTFNAVLYSAALKFDETVAQDMMSKLKAAGFEPDSESYASMVIMYAGAGAVDKAVEWHQAALTAGIKPSISAISKLSELYADLGDFDNAVKITKDAGVVPARSWSTLLQAVAGSRPDLVEDILRSMAASGVEPGRQALIASMNSLGTPRTKQLCAELGFTLQGVL